MNGLMTSEEKSIQPTKSSSNFPYTVKISIPLSETDVNTRPKIPKGANWMIQRTTVEMASAKSATASKVVGEASCLSARPITIAQKSTPR